MTLYDEMFGIADRDKLPGDPPVRIKAMELKETIDGKETPTPQRFLGAWARAKRAYCDYTGTFLVNSAVTDIGAELVNFLISGKIKEIFRQGMTMPEIQTMKKCSRCGKDKPISEFTKDRKRKDGLRDHCRQCRSEEHKIWYNGSSHEKAKEYIRNYCRNYSRSEKSKDYRRNYMREYWKSKRSDIFPYY
jgi:hypothetical protein